MITLPRLLFLVTLAGFLLAPALVQGQTVCADREVIVEAFRTEYGEVVTARAVDDNQMVEMLVSPKGTWTIIRTVPNGLTCAILAGSGWEAIPVKQGRGS